MIYDDSFCASCGKEPKIHLQIGSSIRNRTSSSLPKFSPWISLTAGSDFVDLAQHPAVIQARFDSIGGRLGDLSVSVEVISNSVVLSSIKLTDTGTMGNFQFNRANDIPVTTLNIHHDRFRYVKRWDLFWYLLSQ